MLPDSESLRCFEAVATLLSFRAAAMQVCLSPASLSERIRKLEEDLGTPLFVRSSRKVSLTAAGARLLPHARSLLEGLRSCPGIARATPPQDPYDLRIGCRIQLAHTWLVPALPHLERLDPLRLIHIMCGDLRELVRQVRRRDIDATIANAGFAEGSLDAVSLRKEEFVLVGQTEWLNRCPLDEPSDAANHVLADLSPDLPLSHYFLNASGGSARWHFRNLHFLGTLAGVRQRILQGGAVGVLPADFAASEIDQGRLVQVLPDVPLHSDSIHFVWRKDHPRADRLAVLAQELREIPFQAAPSR
jgi:DNA-binding transcriptional LysR family regulator